jgi:hypothetical protein
MQSFRRIAGAAAAVAMLAWAASAWAEPPKSAKPQSDSAGQAEKSKDSSASGRSAPKPHEQGGYLGVAVEEITPALAAHLPGTLQAGRGVLVEEVVADSPADKAGLKEHDVIVSYGDQKLFSPEQLARLVESDKPQQAVTLGIVREGKKDEVKVTLGSPESEPQAWRNRRNDFRRFGRGGAPWDWPLVREPGQQTGQANDRQSNWESFDSLTIRKTGDKTFKAEIQYLDKNGKLAKQSFEGSRDELRRDIEAQKDLPDNERNQLLRSLNLQDLDHSRSARFPGWEWAPF